MWGIAIVVAMAALTGVYMLPSERNLMIVEDHEARELAESMGVYRQAVSAYFSANDISNTSVDIDTLKNQGMLRAWAAHQKHSTTTVWKNYRDSSGAIYIYPGASLSTNIVNQLLKLSKNSMTVGIYRASDNSLYSPVNGTRVTVASLGAASIPDGAPVWVAARN